MVDNNSNPGKVMAAAVDSEIAAFQKLQSELQQYRADQQVLLSQQNENEMVKQVCLMFGLLIITSAYIQLMKSLVRFCVLLFSAYKVN